MNDKELVVAVVDAAEDLTRRIVREEILKAIDIMSDEVGRLRILDREINHRDLEVALMDAHARYRRLP